jgi:hypothetical protein
VPPEDGAGARATPPCPVSRSPLPTVPRPAQCEQPAAAFRPLAAASSSPVLAPAQNRWPRFGWQEFNRAASRATPVQTERACLGRAQLESFRQEQVTFSQDIPEGAGPVKCCA